MEKIIVYLVELQALCDMQSVVEMSTNRYARDVAVPKNDNMRLISGCCHFLLPTFSTCGGSLLAMTRLFRFTLFIRGFAHRLPVL